MTKQQYKEAITPEMVREIFGRFIIDQSQPRYAITVSGKIIAVGGKIFYDSREQAVRGFYNSFSWRARREIWVATHHDDTTWGWWRQPESKNIWSAFKEVLTETYGFNIIQI